MDYLYQKLPKDLANIVEEYAKDRTNYDRVMSQLDIIIRVVTARKRYFTRNVIFVKRFNMVYLYKSVSKPMFGLFVTPIINYSTSTKEIHEIWEIKQEFFT